MSSRLPRDEALEKEDRIYEMKKIKNSPPVSHLLQAQQATALPYAKVKDAPALEATSTIAQSNHLLQEMNFDSPEIIVSH